MDSFYRASVSGDLLLCYSSLAYFLNKDAPYTCLTNLALITRNALSDINSIIPSKMDILLIFLIHSMLNERITPEELEKNPISSKDDRFLFLESIYSCVFMLVKRCSSSSYESFIRFIYEDSNQEGFDLFLTSSY